MAMAAFSKSLISHRFHISSSTIPSNICSCNASTSFLSIPTKYTTPSTLSRPLLHRSVALFPPHSTSLATPSTFTWDDVFHISNPDTSQDDDSSDFSGYFEKIKLANRGPDKQSEFLPFVIANQVIGYVHHGFAKYLKKYVDVFTFPEDNSVQFGAYLTLHESLKTPEDRTLAVAAVVKYLGEEVFPGTRNELYPVTSSFGAPILFSIERAAATYFGIKAYSVHMNGYIEKDGEKFMWIAKRSQMKPTFPGKLDQLVAGGLPQGISLGDNLIKECEEEAGIPRSISKQAIPVGAVSYLDINGYCYERDVLFCYDLKLPESFIPNNQDGEVEGFMLLPVTEVAKIIRRTRFFKPNCSLVIIDFLFRHGYINPDNDGYLDLLRSFKSWTCSRENRLSYSSEKMLI